MSSVPRLTASSLNCTPATATLSVAFAETATAPETIAPPVGAVMETEGGAPSGVVKVKSADVARLPAASRDLTR